MPAIAARPVRLKCDLANPNRVRDDRTGSVPIAMRGGGLLVQCGLYLNGAVIDDKSNYDSATLELKAYSAADDTIGELQVSKALAAADLANCSDAAWLAGTGQHAQFALTSDDLNLAEGDYWLVIAGQTAAGELVLWAAGIVRIFDHGLVTEQGELPDFLPTDGPLVKRGSVDLATDDATAEIEFTTPFASAPRGVFVQIISPADGFVVSQTVDADPTTEGFTVRFGGNIPGVGYSLTWLAVL